MRIIELCTQVGGSIEQSACIESQSEGLWEIDLLLCAASAAGFCIFLFTSVLKTIGPLIKMDK